MDVTAWVAWLLELVRSVDPTTRTLVAGLGMLLETSVLLGLVVPGDTIMLAAATGIEHAGQWALLVTAALAGAVAGESIGFALGRWLGPRIAAGLAARLPRLHRHWLQAHRYVERRGGPAIFLSRFLPVAHSVVPLVVGASGMGYRRFLAWTVPACALWALLYASAGWLAAGTFRELSERIHGAGYLFVAIIVAFLAIVWLAKRWLRARETKHLGGDA